jgi:hypothetical protein
MRSATWRALRAEQSHGGLRIGIIDLRRATFSPRRLRTSWQDEAREHNRINDLVVSYLMLPPLPGTSTSRGNVHKGIARGKGPRRAAQPRFDGGRDEAGAFGKTISGENNNEINFPS